MCICLLCLHTGECRCMWSPEGGVTFFAAGFAGICEPPDVGARNQSPAFCKNSEGSQLLAHLSSTLFLIFCLLFALCMYVCVDVYMSLSAQVDQGPWLPWSWSYRQLLAIWHRCWELRPPARRIWDLTTKQTQKLQASVFSSFLNVLIYSVCSGKRRVT